MWHDAQREVGCRTVGGALRRVQEAVGRADERLAARHRQAQRSFVAVPVAVELDAHVVRSRLAKEHLGLLKGYRFALQIEKANGVAGLQQVARELIVEVDRVKGPSVARAVRRALLM